MNRIKKIKNQSYINLFVVLGIIILLNIISRNYYFRLDMTKDKRFSLGNTTKKILNNLDDRVYIKVYLGGELPAGFRRLKESTFELLNEMRVNSGKKLDFEFLDPLEEGTNTEKNAIIKQLIEYGLQPIDLEVRTEGETTNKTIFPGALITYKNKTLSVRLLKDQLGVSPDEVLHNSIVSLEYNLVSTITKLSTQKKKKVAFVEGHGELNKDQTLDIQTTLEEFYDVDRIKLQGFFAKHLEKYDLLIIAKPDSFFSDVDKYKIDQFVVRGGKIIWLIDPLFASMDSLENSYFTTTMTNDLNLQDLFLKYGVRFQPNLIQDYNAHFIKWLITENGQNVRSWKKWVFFPLIRSRSNHPIVKNLNDVLFKFASSIDTTTNPDIKKTVLLQSSPNSRLVYHPALIDIRIVNQDINPSAFNKGNQNVAVLVEGRFNSAFTNRLSPQTLQSENYKDFQPQSSGRSQMIFISDGDVIENYISTVSGKYYPLGYDYFTNQQFGNKDFIMNCVDYLLDDNGIINLRSKQIKLRLLDQSKVDEDENFWKTINMVVPVIFLLIFAFLFNSIRKYKYTKK